MSDSINEVFRKPVIPLDLGNLPPPIPKGRPAKNLLLNAFEGVEDPRHFIVCDLSETWRLEIFI